MGKTIRTNEIVTEDCVISPIRLKDGRTGAIKKTRGGDQEILDQREFDIDGIIYELEDLTFPQLIRNLATNKGKKSSVSNVIYRVRKHVKRVLKISDEAATFITVYVLGTYTYDDYEYLSYLFLSGYPGSGKSTALKAIHALAYNSYYTSGLISDSATFRTIDAIAPHLCIDEAQSENTNNHSSDTHKLLAEGNHKLGNVTKSEQSGKGTPFKPRLFRVFCPKTLSGRGNIGDAAIMSRCVKIAMKPVDRKDRKELIPVSNKAWLAEAQEIKNDLLLYRQERLLGENSAADLDYEPILPAYFTARNIQVNEWLLNECPDEEILKAVISVINGNIEDNLQRREEQIEPTILNEVFDLLVAAESKPQLQRVYLKQVAESVQFKHGYKTTPRQVGDVLSANEIQRKRDKSGRYILATPDMIADRLTALGLTDPRAALTTPSTSKKGDFQ